MLALPLLRAMKKSELIKETEKHIYAEKKKNSITANNSIKLVYPEKKVQTCLQRRCKEYSLQTCFELLEVQAFTLDSMPPLPTRDFSPNSILLMFAGLNVSRRRDSGKSGGPL